MSWPTSRNPRERNIIFARILQVRGVSICRIEIALLCAIVTEVDDREIRIVGQKDVMEQAVLANGGPHPGFAVLFANGAP
jgi:hypothetical protein